MDMRPTRRQQTLIDQARALALDCFAPRAADLDRKAEFPFADYKDLREAGFLGLCIPEENGGLGADLETYCLVSEQIAQGNASTALTFNMHCLTMLMMGEMAKAHDMTETKRTRHKVLSTENFREVMEKHVFYGQPHSEPVEEGETDQIFTVGGRRFGTTADKTEDGYVLNGRKFFVSLAGAADYFATPAILNQDGSFVERTLYLKVPREAPGVKFTGEWDPIGMRATVSRDMELNNVFVPDDAEILPPGIFGSLYLTSAHGPLLFSATFLGIMQAAYTYTLAYLTGSAPGAPSKGEIGPTIGNAVADMSCKIEAARALYYQAISEAKLQVTHEIRQRARAAHLTVQRTVVEVTQEAIRVCGGRALLKKHPLERYLRDAQAASVMRPWTREIATQAMWKSDIENVVENNTGQ